MERETTRLTDQERLSVKIEEILSKIGSDPNPEELESIKKLIKQKVPFTRRGYFSAMLLKTLMEKNERNERKRPVEKTKALFEKKDDIKQGIQKDEKILPENAKTLYLNVGKMKHLYGKDLSKLLQTELGITRNDIYSLRVHDKYSFITMSEDNCNKAIEKLNGKEINGRVAQINFSNR